MTPLQVAYQHLADAGAASQAALNAYLAANAAVTAALPTGNQVLINAAYRTLSLAAANSQAAENNLATAYGEVAAAAAAMDPGGD